MVKKRKCNITYNNIANVISTLSKPRNLCQSFYIHNDTAYNVKNYILENVTMLVNIIIITL